MRKSDKFGFTLVEAVVVVGIMVILTATLLGYTRTSEQQVVFFKEQSLLINALLRAKAFSIETFQPGLNPGGERICGWGVHFDKVSGEYVIYRDIPPINQPNPCDQMNTGNYTSGRAGNFEVFKLNGAILKISDLRSGLANPATLDVFFKPPEPSVLFHPDPGSSGDAEIKLELIDGTRAISIKVNRAGQVTF